MRLDCHTSCRDQETHSSILAQLEIAEAGLTAADLRIQELEQNMNTMLQYAEQRERALSDDQSHRCGGLLNLHASRLSRRMDD